jgi:hypothetical protein
MQARFAVDSFYSEKTQGAWVGTEGLFYCTRKERSDSWEAGWSRERRN